MLAARICLVHVLHMCLVHAKKRFNGLYLSKNVYVFEMRED